MVQPQDGAPGTILQSHRHIASQGGYSLSQVTTTSTGVWVVAYGPWTLELPVPKCKLNFGLNLMLKHSVADAQYGIYIAVYENVDYTGAAETFMLQDPLPLPNIAGRWDKAPSHGSGYPAAQSIPAGTRYLVIAMKNYTAGTLTLMNNTGYEFVDWDEEG